MKRSALLLIALSAACPGSARFAAEDSAPWRDSQGPCDGVRHLDRCWYLTYPGASCKTFCAGHGGYDAATATFVGTSSQGGSQSECEAIFDALGYGGKVLAGYRSDGAGLGCHRWDNGRLWWLTRPAFDAADMNPYSNRVCACRR